MVVAGLSQPVLYALANRIKSLLSSHANSLSHEKANESYKLVSQVSHGGNALWLFGREATLGDRLGKPLKATLGLFWGGMGNKGAVGIRVPIRRGNKEGGWEIFT